MSAIASVIFEFFMKYLLKIWSFHKIRKIEAASHFRTAFSEEIARCKSKKDFKVKAILFEAIDKHQEAVGLYEPFLKEPELGSFQNAWDKYRQLHSSPGLNEFIPESGIGKEGYIQEISEQEQRKLSLSHLNKLASYAPIK
jgi:hypothetical protein